MEFKINNNSGLPMYRQLAEYMYSEIKSGKWGKGEKLPTEPELALEFNTTRTTLRKAIKIMIERGLITQIKGQGTFVADNLSSQFKKKRIGLISGSSTENVMRDIYYSVVIMGIKNAFKDVSDKYEILLLNRHDKKDILTRIYSENLDGVINVSGDHRKYISEKLNAIPHVLVDCDYDFATRNNLVMVRVDYQSSFKRQLEYLLKMGHKNIATIVSRESGEERLREIFRKNKLLDNQTFVLTHPELYAHGISRLIDNILKNIKPSAFFFCSYPLASSGYSYLKELGIKIPEEISVAGVGNYRRIFEGNDAEFMTTDQPIFEMGEMAGQMLLTQLGGSILPQRQRIIECKQLFKPTVAPLINKNHINEKIAV